jgi:hypothetical protein
MLTKEGDNYAEKRQEDRNLLIKVGDRIWIHQSHSRYLKTVTKITAAQIFIGPARYWKLGFDKPRRYAGQGIGVSSSLGRVATPEECAGWDREQEAKAKEASQKASEAVQHSALLMELGHLFGTDLAVAVRDTEWGGFGRFDVVIGGLTEAQVRRIKIQGA